MSRRFGRNQRRRAREEQARLTQEAARLREAVDMANGLTRHVSEKASRLQDEIARAKALLPEGSILFDPVDLKVEFAAGDPLRLPIFPPPSCSRARCDEVMSSMAIQTISLDYLLTDVVLDRLNDQLHFCVELADGYVRYAITRRALTDPKVNEQQTVRRIGEEIARQLLIDLRKNLTYR